MFFFFVGQLDCLVGRQPGHGRGQVISDWAIELDILPVDLVLADLGKMAGEEIHIVGAILPGGVFEFDLVAPHRHATAGEEHEVKAGIDHAVAGPFLDDGAADSFKPIFPFEILHTRSERHAFHAVAVITPATMGGSP